MLIRQATSADALAMLQFLQALRGEGLDRSCVMLRYRDSVLMAFYVQP